MRHRVYGKKLGRDKNQRTALLKSLVQSIFTHGTIETSEAKAKAVKGLIDKVINLAKNKNSQRLLQAYFSKNLQERLIKEVAPKLNDRNSGYTKTIRVGTREGDRTMVVRMSLINNEKLEPIKKEEVKKEVKQVKVEEKKAAPKKEQIKEKAVKPKAKKAVKKETK